MTSPFFPALVALASIAAPAQAAVGVADFERAAGQIRALVEATRKVPGAPPAAALILVRRGADPIVDVDGVADVRSGARADGDTPFYIASMTKAYIGLLAAELDRKDVLKLDSTIADHWPDLRIPGTDTHAVTLRNLLTHHMLFENPVLSFRTAYTDEVAASDYPKLLASYSTLRQPGFSYSNLGYLLYGAILKKKTGRSWKDWLESDLFRPLGLRHTSARSSDFPVVTAAHQWTENGWHSFAMKPDPLMHPAGGLVTSPKDMARWLAAHLERRALPPQSFAMAQKPLAVPPAKRGDARCDGYALGWNRCTAYGLPYLEHGGGYTGFRSQMLIAPDQGVAFAFLTNSDSMTGGLSGKLQDAFLHALADPSYKMDPAKFAQNYAAEVQQQATGRASRESKDRADPKWGGWKWKPSMKDLDRYAGRYSNASLGDLIVTRDGGRLTASLGSYQFDLVPATEDVFAGVHNPAETRETVAFSGKGNVRILRWNGESFIRRQE